jgi:tripartite ATP-independent transporter DctP family solute receptor
MKRWVLMMTAIVLVLGMASYGFAQVVFKLGHVAPPQQIQGKASTFFKTHVEEKTKGAVKIEVYPLSQLGGQRALMDAVLAGTLDLAPAGAPLLSTVMPEFNALCLPFVIANEDIFWDVVRDKEYRDKTFAIVRKKGAEPFGFTDVCGRGFLNKKRPVRTPDDLKGLNIRVMEGSIYTDMWRAMGANTRTIPFPELYTALQQGVVEGEDNALDMANFMKFTEIEKHFTATNQTMQTNLMIMASASWNKLNDAQKKIFVEAGEAMEKYSQEEFRKDKVDAYKVAREQYKVNCIENLTPQERAAFRKTVAPVLEKYQKIIGDDYFKMFTGLAKKYESKHIK